jgi:hypothetical protein
VRDANGNCVREQATTFWAGGKSQYESRPSYQDGIDQIGSQRGIPHAAFAGDPIHGATRTTPAFPTMVLGDGFLKETWESAKRDGPA